METEAAVGWLAIGLVAFGYDYWAIKHKKQTLSSGYWHAVRHPTWRWVFIPAWLILTTHLFFGKP